MKYLKKYNESYSIEDIEDIFLPLIDIGAVLKIYDGFFNNKVTSNGMTSFFQDEKRITNISHISKLVIIKLKIKMKSIDVEPWREIQNSSGMYFQSKDSFIKYREIINDVYGCLSHLSCDYNVELLSDELRVLLIFDKINENDLVSGEKMKNAYQFLSDELVKMKLMNVDISNYGTIRISGKYAKEDYFTSILKSIVSFNHNWDGTWEEYDKIPKILETVEKIDKMGYVLNISDYDNRDDEWQIKITKKK